MPPYTEESLTPSEIRYIKDAAANSRKARLQADYNRMLSSFDTIQIPDLPRRLDEERERITLQNLENKLKEERVEIEEKESQLKEYESVSQCLRWVYLALFFFGFVFVIWLTLGL